MPQIESILCPSDFSEFSVNPYEYAQSLAWHYKARLFLQCVVSTGLDKWGTPDRRLAQGGKQMRLSAKSMAVAGGVLWGSALLLVGLINLATPTYGSGFLAAMSSVYPWFHASRTFGDVAIGTVDATLDWRCSLVYLRLTVSLVTATQPELADLESCTQHWAPTTLCEICP